VLCQTFSHKAKRNDLSGMAKQDMYYQPLTIAKIAAIKQKML
jgi:hypothetical protein